jgi:hypothetical protein
MRGYVCAVLFALTSAFAFAAAPPVIDNASINYTAHTITIAGAGFSAPTVEFNAAVLHVVSASATRIVASLPVEPQGSYELIVTNSDKLSVTFDVTYGPTGPPGVAGPQGAQGPKGEAGATGPQGPIGAASTVAGPQGPQGLTGPMGLQGLQGPMGPQGLTGATGAMGAPGADSLVPGPQGPQGLTGPIGPQGLTGPQGLQGSAGPMGPAGNLNWTGTWNSATNYNVGDAVTFAGASYVAVQVNNGQQPNVSTGAPTVNNFTITFPCFPPVGNYGQGGSDCNTLPGALDGAVNTLTFTLPANLSTYPEFYSYGTEFFEIENVSGQLNGGSTVSLMLEYFDTTQDAYEGSLLVYILGPNGYGDWPQAVIAGVVSTAPTPNLFIWNAGAPVPIMDIGSIPVVGNPTFGVTNNGPVTYNVAQPINSSWMVIAAAGTQGAQGAAGVAGPAGPQGPQGPAGASVQGPTGPQGPQGPGGPATLGNVNVNNLSNVSVPGSNTVLSTLNLPTGSNWLISYSLFFTGDPSVSTMVSCYLQGASSNAYSGGPLAAGSMLTLGATAPAQSATTVTLTCASGNGTTSSLTQGTLTATQVGSITSN